MLRIRRNCSGPDKIEILSDKRRVARGGDLAHRMPLASFGSTAPARPLGMSIQSHPGTEVKFVFIGGVHPVRPIGVGRNGGGQGLVEEDFARRDIRSIEDALLGLFSFGHQAQ